MGRLLVDQKGCFHLKRYWVEQSLSVQYPIEISGDVFHHIVDVCRHQINDKMELLTTDGFAYLSVIEAVKKKSVILIPLEQRKIPELPRPHLTLNLSFPKFQTFETVLEKAVELGVTSVQPFFSEFSFVKSASKISPEKWTRWKKIVVTATQQSGRGELMLIHPPLDWTKMVQNLKINQDQGNFCLFAYEGNEGKRIGQVLQNAQPPLSERAQLQLIVGSEGGFSSQEARQLVEMNIQTCSLGQQILRVETACMALLGILKYESRVI